VSHPAYVTPEISSAKSRLVIALIGFAAIVYFFGPPARSISQVNAPASAQIQFDEDASPLTPDVDPN